MTQEDLRTLARSIQQARLTPQITLLKQAANARSGKWRWDAAVHTQNSSPSGVGSTNDDQMDVCMNSDERASDGTPTQRQMSIPRPTSTNVTERPEVMNLVTKEEAEELFKIYFERLNPHCCLLLPHFHTPTLICSRSPFLFTVVCAITARFHPSNPSLLPRLIPLAHKMVFEVLEKGYRSVEIVQGCLLLTMWGAGHTQNYEQERTWLLLGLAIRVATEINLNRPIPVKPTNGTNDSIYKQRVAEVRNRERTWLLCFILDRSLSAQVGKPYTISEDTIIRSVRSWWKHPLAEPPDSGITAYAEFQRCISRCLEFIYSGTSNVSGIQTNCDYLVVIKSIETQLLAWNNEWQQHRSQLPASQDADIEYRKVVGRFYLHYGLLLVNSFGLQNAMDNSKVDAAHFFARCHTAASQCAIIVRDELVPRGFLRYSPDSHFVLISYAVLTLLKLSLTEFCSHLHNAERTVSLVKDVAECLEKIAVGPQHSPALYATFLRALINAKLKPTSIGADSPTYPTTTPSDQTSITNQNTTSNPNTPNAYSVFQNTMPETLYFDSTPGFDLPPPSRPADLPEDLLGGFEAIDAPQQPGKGFSTLTPSSATLAPGTNVVTGDMPPPSTMESTPFPALMMPTPQPAHGVSLSEGLDTNMLSMDSILSPSFWDNILIPGFSTDFGGLSGGMVYGANGSGLITPRANSPGPF